MQDKPLDKCFLPNFCGLRMVFVVVIIAQLFAFTFVLVPDLNKQADEWQRLGLISLFVQWCALMSCGVLCIARSYIAKYKINMVSAISYSLVLLVVYVVSEVAYWLAYPTLQYNYSHTRFIVSNVLIAAIVTGPILRYFYIQHQWRENVRAESESRLQALQARIRPHFLFNSMNTIASLTRSNPALAEQAVENLSALFRASLNDMSNGDVATACSLDKEIQLCKSYIDIEKLRLAERLEVEWQIEDVPMTSNTLPLLIQPLIENAIYHGIELRPEGGRILIQISQQEKNICVRICNPIIESSRESNGFQIAQNNIKARLQAVYADKASLVLEPSEQEYCVMIKWPLNNA